MRVGTGRDGGGGGAFGVAAGAEELPDGGDDREHDDGDDDQLEVVLDEWLLAEESADEGEQDDPADAAGDVVEGESGVGHLADAGDEGGEGSDDGDETGEDDGLAAVFFVELVGVGQVLLVQQARVFPREDLGAELVADGVVDGVAEDGGDGHEDHGEGEVDFEDAGGGQCADGEEEGVAGEEGGDDEAGFAEEDDEEDDVKPRAQGIAVGFEGFVQVQEDIDELMEQFHAAAPFGVDPGLSAGIASNL